MTPCISYFTSIFVSIWKRKSKNWKISKKKEAIILRCGLIRKGIPISQAFKFSILPYTQNRKLGEPRQFYFTSVFGSIWNSKSKNRKNYLKKKTLSLRYDQNVVSPALSPSLFFVDVINEWPLWATYWENSSKINHKHNVKLIKNLEVSIQSSSLKQIKIYSENFGKNKICFIVKNKYLITIRSCFVPVTIIRFRSCVVWKMKVNM